MTTARVTVDRPDISVVVPAKDEVDNLPILIEEIMNAFSGKPFEIIVVDDGSHDGTEARLRHLAQDGRPFLHSVRHEIACGQSAAIRTGVLHAMGTIIVTTDADGQNDPAYMPALVDALLEAGEGAGMVAGQRMKRTDGVAKRIASRLANKIRSSLLKDETRDSGCGLKAVRRDVFLKLPYFDGWHRFMAAIVLREGYKVLHVDVIDRPRRFGQSKYGILDRALTGLLDIFGVWWLRRRRRNVPKVTKIV